MALHHHHHALFLSSSSSECRLFSTSSVSCRNQPTHVAFRPKLARTVIGSTFRNGSVSLRRSNFDGGFDLEDEIFEFMKRSERPNMFPTKEELIAAGRTDLVNAIVKEGGWLSAGWDGREEGEERREAWQIEETNNDRFQYPDTCLRSDLGDFSPYDPYSSSALSTSTSSSSSFSLHESTEMKHGGGVEGILSRLEKERAAFLTIEPSEKKGNESRRKETREEATSSWRELTKMYGDRMWRSPAAMSNGERNTRPLSSNTNEVHLDGSEQHSVQDLNNNDDGANPHHIWRVKSLRERNHIDTNSGVNGNGRRPLSSSKSSNDDIDLDNQNCMDDDESYQESIRSRIKKLESELSSMIHLVRSGTSAHNWSEEYGNSLEKLHELSNAWEFHETEIMKSRAKLRSIRAKLAILEGKMGFEIMEAQKVAEEKQKRIEKAQRVLTLLRTACIVWSNSANDVLLAGSFDGWTSQRRMERTSSGIFVLNLKLYPGRYEIKFIVDGVWRTDPLRPVVNNNGYENNLLIIS
ncbi:protein PTST homolog 2, chloroplastic isoform X1 [Nymphaea colorata]|nr:protein PTST homolog 2, chloroplastic isoform X1 [Nymphaea colorata]